MVSRDNKLSLPNVTLVGVEGVKNNVAKFLFAADQCTKNIEFKEVKLLCPFDLNHKDHVSIDAIPDISLYSRLMFQDVHKYVDTDFLLIFQSDGFILNSAAWSDKFLEYDFVGSPWFDGVVGNGGFSLRSKKLMKAVSEIDLTSPRSTALARRVGAVFNRGVADEMPLRPDQVAEDHLICREFRAELGKQGMKFAPENVAEKFSLEHNWGHPYTWTDQFGFHDDEITDISNWEGFEKMKELSGHH
jgi:hypothetical protein